MLLRNSRSRKIRCDGAKPICHNCSRRTGVTSSSPPECTYDTAPKRRGPDRNPGARQRLNTQDVPAEGGKVRKRRRRQPESSPDKGLEDNVNSLTNGDAADGPDQKTMRTDPIASISTAAQSQVATKPTGLTVHVDDLDAYEDQSHNTAYSLGSSSGSSHIVSPIHFPPPLQQGAVVHQQEAASLTPPQVHDVICLEHLVHAYPPDIGLGAVLTLPIILQTSRVSFSLCGSHSAVNHHRHGRRLLRL